MGLNLQGGHTVATVRGMRAYAERTDVDVEKSRHEVERMLRDAGADQIIAAWGRGASQAMVAFVLGGVPIRIMVPLPTEAEIAKTATGKERKNLADRESAKERLERQRWRALVLLVKAKLEVIRLGVSSVEEEFLAHVMLPRGETVGSKVLSELHKAMTDGALPQLMLPGKTS